MDNVLHSIPGPTWMLALANFAVFLHVCGEPPRPATAARSAGWPVHSHSTHAHVMQAATRSTPCR